MATCPVCDTPRYAPTLCGACDTGGWTCGAEGVWYRLLPPRRLTEAGEYLEYAEWGGLERGPWSGAEARFVASVLEGRD